MNSKDALKVAKKMLEDKKINTNQEYLETIQYMMSLVDCEKEKKIKKEISKIISKYSGSKLEGLQEVDRSFGFNHTKRKKLK